MNPVPTNPLPMSQGSWLANGEAAHIAVGGRLTLEPTRLIFTVQWFSRIFGGRRAAWAIDLADIAAVDVIEASWKGWLGGGMRRRLQVIGVDGSTDRFVIDHVDWICDYLRHAVAAVKPTL